MIEKRHRSSCVRELVELYCIQPSETLSGIYEIGS